MVRVLQQQQGSLVSRRIIEKSRMSSKQSDLSPFYYSICCKGEVC